MRFEPPTNSDSVIISFFGSKKGELAQKLDKGKDAVRSAVDSSVLPTARNGRVVAPGPKVWVFCIHYLKTYLRITCMI